MRVPIILMGLFLAACSPAASPSASSAASPTLTPSQAPSAWPTIAPSAVAVPPQLDLGHIGFWNSDWPMASADLSRGRLRVGTLDGHLAATIGLHYPGMGPLDVPLLPQPAGPGGGLVVYGTDDGRQAVLHVVSTGSGVDRQLLTTTSFISNLAIDPSGKTAYYLLLDRATGRFGGVSAIATAGGEPHNLITDSDLPPVAAGPFIPAAQVPYYPRLSVSMDGNWVVLASCRPSGCDLVAAHPGGDSPLRWQSFQFGEEMVGVSGDLLIGSSSCAEPPCDGFVIDLRTGDRQPLGGADAPFTPRQLIAGPHGPLVLGDTGVYEKGEWQVEALDLTDRSRRFVFSGSFKPAYTIVKLADPRSGAELPPGWFLFYRNADAAPAPYPDFSAARPNGSTETKLPILTPPRN